jgi:hypothetical protein
MSPSPAVHQARLAQAVAVVLVVCAQLLQQQVVVDH